jgi:hypothetical protein
MASRILDDNSLATVSIDDAAGIVTLTRKATPLDLAILAQATSRLATLVPLRERSHLALLFDMRQAPFATPEAEAKILEYAGQLRLGFLCAATVLATAVGRLQAARVQREGKVAPAELGLSFEEAQHHLRAIVSEHRARTASRDVRR